MLKMNQSSFSFNFHSAQLLKHPNRVFFFKITRLFWTLLLIDTMQYHLSIIYAIIIIKKRNVIKKFLTSHITLLKRKSLIFFNVSLSSKQFLNIKTILNQPETRNVPDKKVIVNTKCDTLQLGAKTFNPQHRVKEK